MNDKEYAKQKKRVQKYIDKWFKAMGLGWFEIDISWSRERDQREPDVLARAHTTWQYRIAEVVFFLPVVAENKDDFLEGAVVHEFVHVLINPLMVVGSKEDLQPQHEYATECIARALRWSRKAGEEDAKA